MPTQEGSGKINLRSRQTSASRLLDLSLPSRQDSRTIAVRQYHVFHANHVAMLNRVSPKMVTSSRCRLMGTIASALTSAFNLTRLIHCGLRYLPQLFIMLQYAPSIILVRSCKARGNSNSRRLALYGSKPWVDLVPAICSQSAKSSVDSDT